MLSLLTRMFAIVTVMAYLLVGHVIYQALNQKSISVSFSTQYLSVLKDTFKSPKSDDELFAFSVPDFNFPEIKIERKYPQHKTVKSTHKRSFESFKPQKATLPFEEIIVLKPLKIELESPILVSGLYKDFQFQHDQSHLPEKIVAVASPNDSTQPEKFEKIVDEVKTTQSAPKEEDLEFFEYSSQEQREKLPVVSDEETKVAKTNPLQMPAIEEKSTQNSTNNNAQVSSDSKIHLAGVEVEQKEEVRPANVAIPKTAMTTQNNIPATPNNHKPETNSLIQNDYSSEVSIQALGIETEKNIDIRNFEIRFPDDESLAFEDYGNGEIKLNHNLASSKMIRTAVLLKKGFIPTTAELIIEEGNSAHTIPLISEEKYSQLIEQLEPKSQTGAILIELDDQTENAKIDVSIEKVVKFDGEFKPVNHENYRYLLFLGVKAGNVMLSYQHKNGENISKIVHVHENELVYEANYFEDLVDHKIKLMDEDLLTKSLNPLSISGDKVSIFATGKTAKKLNSNTYRLNFTKGNLAGRRYLELNHLNEPIFIGFRDNQRINVPSENLMGQIIKSTSVSGIEHRCLIQLNLQQKVQMLNVGTESVNSSLLAKVNYLDRDGKFYDSPSDLTEKIIISGEAQTQSSGDAKINISVQYTNGTIQFLQSYCSPNTYLVEQL